MRYLACLCLVERRTMVVLVCLGLSLPLLACSVPVFRYALERWPADTYQYVVFHDGPLSSADRHLLEPLDQIDALGHSRPPLQGRTVDVAQDIQDAMIPLWDKHKNSPLPTLVLVPPVSDPNVQALWEAPLTQASVQMLIDSPVRSEIVQRLTDGQTAVWLLVLSQDEEENVRVEADLRQLLETMTRELKLPHELSEEDTVYDAPMSDVDLKIEFSMVPLDLNDPNEIILTSIIREAMLDTLDQYLPAAIPIFGRGRALTVLDKASIGPDVVAEVCQFLVGPCSCEVKAMNPGVDLLIPVDWDGLITGMIGMDDIVPALIVPIASTPVTPNDTQVSDSEPPPDDTRPVAVSGTLTRNLVILAILAVIALAVATLALRKSPSK
ncbi:MAG: hypothetical protein GY809_16540 [Planctomycetes bacterium]|nr:hypothetical protein [Planctomycetota bacterium]